jgi:hypothetical protein
VANGIGGSSIKLFADHVSVTEIKNHKVTELPIKDIVALNYLKHFTPIAITLTYVENGKISRLLFWQSRQKEPSLMRWKSALSK